MIFHKISGSRLIGALYLTVGYGSRSQRRAPTDWPLRQRPPGYQDASLSFNYIFSRTGRLAARHLGPHSNKRVWDT